MRALDVFGKWSLIDMYVLVLMMIAFHFELFLEHGQVPLPQLGITDFGFTVDVLPGWGFYGFLLATTMSLLISNYLFYSIQRQQRRLDAQDAQMAAALLSSPLTSTPGAEGRTPPRLHQKQHGRSTTNLSSSTKEISVQPLHGNKYLSIATSVMYNTSSGEKSALRVWGCYLTSMMLVCTLAMLWMGLFVDSFEFQFEGLAGLILGKSLLLGNVERRSSLLCLGCIQ